jgi:hypothetical protein
MCFNGFSGKQLPPGFVMQPNLLAPYGSFNHLMHVSLDQLFLTQEISTHRHLLVLLGSLGSASNLQ